MTSLRSHTFNFFIRHSHLLRGKLRKEKFDMNTSIAQFRLNCEKGAARFSKIPEGLQVQSLTIEGIHSEWLLPKGSGPGKMILYFHGGGYVSGSCNDHRGIVSKFASLAGVSTLIFEYRLAPEHPFPAAVDDSVRVYRWLLSEGFAPGNIIFAGESAGGGLTLATLLYLKDNDVPLPAAVVAISPWTDLTCSGDSYKTKNRLSPAPLDSWFVFGSHYRGNHPADHPYISPLFGNPAGLPPLFINSGVDDELFDDGEMFTRKAKKAGVDVTFRAGEGMVHCYPLLAPMFPEATQAMDEIVEFIRKKLEIA